MKHKQIVGFCILIMLAFSSCQIVTGIFKAGVWSGVLIVVGIIALIIYIISRVNKNN